VARHYLEKTASEADIERENSHRLDRLWQNLLPMIVEIFPDGDRAWDKKAGRLIRQMDAMDRRAQKFRYPSSKEGVRNLQSFYSFDLTNFVQHAEWLHGYFGGTGDAMMADIEAGPEGGVFF